MISNTEFKNQYGISYAYLHELLRIRLMQKIPLTCINCGSTNNVELANLNDHVYSMDISDYTFLCRKCHIEFDGRLNNLKQGEETILRNSLSRNPDMTERECMRCHTVKPLSEISSNGSYCKDCDNQCHKDKLRARGKSWVLKLREDNAKGVRTCVLCRVEKPLDDFVHEANAIRRICKQCYPEHKRKYFYNYNHTRRKDRADTRYY